MVDNAPRKAPSRRARKKRAAVETTRREKEFLYRGKSVADLQAMSLDEVMELVNARDRRFIKRCLKGQENEAARKFWEKVQSAEDGGTIRTHVRDFPVLPQLVGRNVAVHDGHEFQSVEITAEMVGHKLGEFATTRKSVSHTGPGVGATRSSKFMPLK